MRRPGGAALRGVAVSVVCVVAVFPFYWMVRTAVAPPDEVFFTGLSLIPDRATFENFPEAWSRARLGSAMANGAFVSLGILAAQLLTTIPAAYAFSKLRFRGRNALFAVVLAALLIPSQTTAVPTFIVLSRLGLADTRIALVLPFVTSALGIFIIRQYMLTIPDALIDAALMDGLSHRHILWRIVVPLSLPAILTFGVYSFLVHWNDFLWPRLIARSPDNFTPPLALAVFQDAERGTEYGILAAGATIVTVPVVAVFLLARSRFTEGIAGGEVVG